MIIERHIGGRIRERRIMLGWDADEFARRLGCIPGHVVTIEKGHARAAEMHEVAKILHVPIGYFYDGLLGEPLPPLAGNDRVRLEMSRNFGRLTSETQQRALSEYVRALAEG